MMKMVIKSLFIFLFSFILTLYCASNQTATTSDNKGNQTLDSNADDKSSAVVFIENYELFTSALEDTVKIMADYPLEEGSKKQEELKTTIRQKTDELYFYLWEAKDALDQEEAEHDGEDKEKKDFDNADDSSSSSHAQLWQRMSTLYKNFMQQVNNTVGKLRSDPEDEEVDDWAEWPEGDDEWLDKFGNDYFEDDNENASTMSENMHEEL